jgi:hypothetical protein
VRSQRLYSTNLDYEKFKALILENPKNFILRCDLGSEKGEKLLSFRLRKYSNNTLQLTPKQVILMVHGIKPNEFLLDLKILKEFASLLKNLFPEGVNFKLYKETHSYYDLKE